MCCFLHGLRGRIRGFPTAVLTQGRGPGALSSTPALSWGWHGASSLSPCSEFRCSAPGSFPIPLKCPKGVVAWGAPFTECNAARLPGATPDVKRRAYGTGEQTAPRNAGDLPDRTDLHEP